MARYTITEEEVDFVRKLFDTKFTQKDIPDAIIESGLVLEEATDYAYQRVLLHFPDLTYSDNVDGFITASLQEPITSLFKRSILYRLAGNIAPSLNRIVSESGGNVSLAIDTPDWREFQTHCYRIAIEQLQQIDSILNQTTPVSLNYDLFSVS